MNIEETKQRLRFLTKDAEDKHRASLEAAVKIGSFLIDLKNSVSVGEWTSFAEEHCEFSKATRNNYMALARYYLATGEYPLNSGLSAAIRLLSASEEVKLKAKELEKSGKVLSETDVRKLKGEKPRTYKHIIKSTVSIRKSLAELDLETVEVKELLNLKDELEDTIDEVSKLIIRKKGIK